MATLGREGKETNLSATSVYVMIVVDSVIPFLTGLANQMLPSCELFLMQ